MQSRQMASLIRRILRVGRVVLGVVSFMDLLPFWPPVCDRITNERAVEKLAQTFLIFALLSQGEGSF